MAIAPPALAYDGDFISYKLSNVKEHYRGDPRMTAVGDYVKEHVDMCIDSMTGKVKFNASSIDVSTLETLHSMCSKFDDAMDENHCSSSGASKGTCGEIAFELLISISRDLKSLTDGCDVSFGDYRKKSSSRGTTIATTREAELKPPQIVETEEFLKQKKTEADRAAVEKSRKLAELEKKLKDEARTEYAISTAFEIKALENFFAIVTTKRNQKLGGATLDKASSCLRKLEKTPWKDCQNLSKVSDITSGIRAITDDEDAMDMTKSITITMVNWSDSRYIENSLQAVEIVRKTAKMIESKEEDCMHLKRLRIGDFTGEINEFREDERNKLEERNQKEREEWDKKNPPASGFSSRMMTWWASFCLFFTQLLSRRQ